MQPRVKPFLSTQILTDMKHGKYICNALKAIRLDIARANGIEYTPTKCSHDGECAGTCPACESEMRYLEREIARKRSLGKAAFIAGLSLGLSSLSAMASNGRSMSAMPSESAVPIHASDTTQRAEIFGMIREQMPCFRGGNDALVKYLHDNIKYPPEAVKDSIQGRVVVQLLIERNGEVAEVQVVRPVHELLDNEVVRVCKSLPRFFPGRVGCKAVAMWFTLPVEFKLSEENEVLE